MPSTADGDRARAVAACDASLMYVPAHFKPDDDDVRELLRNLGAADLITSTDEGLLATMLPLIWIEPAAGVDGWGAFHGHVARNNRQWKVPPVGEAMAIVRGPDAYISPGWYATKREHGRVVPTWNYITVHAHGRLTIHDDPAWVEVNVRALSDRHEASRDRPWSVDDAPGPYVDGQLKAIVGVELVIDRVESKWKLSQNRSDEDIAGTIEGLEATGGTDVASAMRWLGRAGTT